MAEGCGSDVSDDVDENNRDERVETIYQGWGAREMAERIVDLEDELGADVDGICTGMHADVAEAHAEIERQAAELRRLEGDCIRLSEDLDEVRATNAELVKDVRDGAHWEGVADRMRDEITRLTELLRYEHNRANSAIDREETAELAAEESRTEIARLRAEAENFHGWRRSMREVTRSALGCAGRTQKECDRYKAAWKSARRRAKTATGAWRYLRFTTQRQRDYIRLQDDCIRELVEGYAQRAQAHDRYRSAWLSARRRAADEANFGMEALALRDAEIRRLKAPSND